MDGQKKRVSVLELILLFLSHFSYTVDAQFSYLQSVNLSSSWTNSPYTLQNSRDSADGSQIRPILVVNNTSPPFVFGFYGNATEINTSFYLVDADGILVWHTNTSGSRLMLNTAGNLMLVDDKDTAIWQSFDHQTDTWLPGQNISVGQTLLARESPFNLATGQYYLSLNQLSQLRAYIGSDPPKQYANFSVNESTPIYGVRFLAQPSYALFELMSLEGTAFRYIRLESEGHLNVYQIQTLPNDTGHSVGGVVIVSSDLFGLYLNDCDYPTKCGSSGVCLDGECSCPGGDSSFFTPGHKRLSEGSVYSFGIVVLEFLFGRKNSDSSQHHTLIDIVKEKAETEELHDLVDGYNEDMQLNKEEARKMITIAIMCIARNSGIFCLVGFPFPHHCVPRVLLTTIYSKMPYALIFKFITPNALWYGS
ncbi:hypothetical protein RJ640_004318 [Escallonia rubra]|uniref:Bulb-type lectin domain-containing protein n=1 Tax=Escallonia rubra TaxID=112253 RepID=A0AA88RUS2_9ASTE|nr:hypothetical protein RJ640_004318 [Escallonia rubra]